MGCRFVRDEVGGPHLGLSARGQHHSRGRGAQTAVEAWLLVVVFNRRELEEIATYYHLHATLVSISSRTIKGSSRVLTKWITILRHYYISVIEFAPGPASNQVQFIKQIRTDLKMVSSYERRRMATRRTMEISSITSASVPCQANRRFPTPPTPYFASLV